MPASEIQELCNSRASGLSQMSCCQNSDLSFYKAAETTAFQRRILFIFNCLTRNDSLACRRRILSGTDLFAGKFLSPLLGTGGFPGGRGCLDHLLGRFFAADQGSCGPAGPANSGLVDCSLTSGIVTWQNTCHPRPPPPFSATSPHPPPPPRTPPPFIH